MKCPRLSRGKRQSLSSGSRDVRGVYREGAIVASGKRWRGASASLGCWHRVIAPYPPPRPSPTRGEGDSPSHPHPALPQMGRENQPARGEGDFRPDEILVTAILEESAADVGWLAWRDGKDAVVVRKVASSPLNPSVIGEFPDPPLDSLVIDRGRGIGPWTVWCRARGIFSCAITPVLARGKVVGVIGLASCSAGALADYDVDRLQLASSLAVHARTYEARLAGLRRMFDEVSRTLENALALDRALRPAGHWLDGRVQGRKGVECRSARGGRHPPDPPGRPGRGLAARKKHRGLGNRNRR